MALLSSWLCTKNTKTMFVKIVHPGGHVELHDRPISAIDLLRRNPKSCVTLPTVFRHPWDIVPPDATLMPGKKYYVVPINTVRKLQSKHSVSNFSRQENQEINQETRELEQSCWLLRNIKDDDPMKNCSTCFLSVMGMKNKDNSNSISSDGKSSSSNTSETKSLNKNKIDGGVDGESEPHPVMKLASLDNNWQPNLDIIKEE